QVVILSGAKYCCEPQKSDYQIILHRTKTQLTQIVNHNARHNPVLIVRRNLHAVERGVLAKDLVHRLLQQKEIRRVADECRDEWRADKDQTFVAQMWNRDRNALEA